MVKDLRKHYDRLTMVEIDHVLQLAAASGGEPVTIEDHVMRVNSLRLQTFRTTGHVCSKCGLKASYYAVEKTAKGNDHSYHLNLWGVHKNGNHILFTHDHMLARCLGGRDSIENCITMCQPCNNAKGMLERDEMKARQVLAEKARAVGQNGSEVIPTRAERSEFKRLDKIQQLNSDPELRAVVKAHQQRLGRNDFPEVFGQL